MSSHYVRTAWKHNFGLTLIENITWGLSDFFLSSPAMSSRFESARQKIGLPKPPFFRTFFCPPKLEENRAFPVRKTRSFNLCLIFHYFLSIVNILILRWSARTFLMPFSTFISSWKARFLPILEIHIYESWICSNFHWV